MLDRSSEIAIKSTYTSHFPDGDDEQFSKNSDPYDCIMTVKAAAA